MQLFLRMNPPKPLQIKALKIIRLELRLTEKLRFYIQNLRNKLSSTVD